MLVDSEGKIVGRDAEGFKVVAGDTEYIGKKLIIATGSMPIAPPITGVKEGLAEIVAKCADNENISFTFYVTVFNEDPTGMLKVLVDSNKKGGL